MIYVQDAIITDYGIDAKEKGLMMENSGGKGPNALFWPGYVEPQNYVVTSGDVAAGFMSVSGIFGADEQATQIFLPGVGNPASYWQQNGASYFLKIQKAPGGVTTNPPVRYFENNVWTPSSAVLATTTFCTPSQLCLQAQVVGQKVIMGIATGNVETVTILEVAEAVNTVTGGTITAGAGVVNTPTSMLGIHVGVSLTVDTVASGVQEVVQVTAISPTTFTATYVNSHGAAVPLTTPAPSFQALFAQTHATTAPCAGALAATQGPRGNAYYLASTGHLYTGDTLVAGDVFTLVYLTYNSDAFPSTIPNATPDTTDPAGVNTRLVPLNIGAGTSLQTMVNRVQSASFKMTLKRDQVQGIGENAIVYGISAVPDVAISMDVKEYDSTLLNQLTNQSKNLTGQGGTIANDFLDLNYQTRKQLDINYALVSGITLANPFDASKIIATWQTPQMVVKDIDYSSTSKADNTVKITALDIQGGFTITYTAPI
jgi:hypothetical protein